MNKLNELKALYARLDASQSPDQAQAVLDEMRRFYNYLSLEEKNEYASDFAQMISARLEASTEELLQERAQMAIEYKGVRYAYPEWVTISTYCKLNAIANIQTVFNWVKRGVVAAHDKVEIPELNDLKLIRNKRYQLSQP